jgi:hypothetical protein
MAGWLRSHLLKSSATDGGKAAAKPTAHWAGEEGDGKTSQWIKSQAE